MGILAIMFQTTWEGLGWSMFTLELQDQVRPAFLGAAVAVGAVILLLFVLKKHGWKVSRVAFGTFCILLICFYKGPYIYIYIYIHIFFS